MFGSYCDVNKTLEDVANTFNYCLGRELVDKTKDWVDTYKTLLDSHQGTIFYNETNIICYMNMVNQYNSLLSKKYSPKTV